MISLAVQRITEFLRTNPPSAEKDVLLRVRQIELLTTAGILQTVVRGDQPHRRSTSDATRFALEAARQADEQAESLLKQIDQIRRDLDADVVRLAREQIRFARAQILHIRSRLAQDKDVSGLRDQADQLAEQLLRSTNNPDLQFRIRRLLAELQLDRKDYAAFDLRLTSLLSAGSSEASRASATALKIRALLQRAQPSDALQECLDSARLGVPETPELMTLRLQALLQLTELLYQLDESPERDTLRAKSAAEFAALKRKALGTLRGVWRDRSLQICARFERVQRVGPEAATLLEEIAILVDEGDLRGARLAVQAMIRQPRDASPKLSAVLFLQSGDLAVRLREWDSAVSDLSQAVQRFQQSDDVPGAAAADLLRVFAIGQQWNADPAAQIAEQRYLTALNEHIAKFAEQPSIAQAREWRARLKRATAPLDAAIELLEIEDAAESSEETSSGKSSRIHHQLERLSLTGDLLLESMPREPESEPDSGTTNPFRIAVARFEVAVRTLAESTESQIQTGLIVLAAQQLGLSLRSRLEASSDWKVMEENTRRLLKAFDDAPTESAGSESSDLGDRNEEQSSQIVRLSGHNNPGVTERAQIICHAMLVLSSVRQLKDAESFESSRIALTGLTWEDRIRTIQQLMRQMPVAGDQMPGDSQLAHILISMMTTQPADTKSSQPIEQRIAELPILNKLSRIAGSPGAMEERLSGLLVAPLTDAQILQLAGIVAESSTVSGTGTRSASIRRFWQSVQKRTKPGQESWFEASLQMAVLAEEAGDVKEASRILGVVGVLHPDWGSPSRKTRATELQMRLETKR